MFAISNSNSKSESARIPRTIKVAPDARAKSTCNPSKLVTSTFLCFAQASRMSWMRSSAEKTRDRAQHLDGDVAVLVQHVAKLFVPEHKAAHRRRGHHGRRPRSVVQESDLSEEIARPEHPLAFAGLDSGGTLEDHEEVTTGLALLAERAA